jgi:hypothetical protein
MRCRQAHLRYYIRNSSRLVIGAKWSSSWTGRIHLPMTLINGNAELFGGLDWLGGSTSAPGSGEELEAWLFDRLMIRQRERNNKVASLRT